MTSICKLDVECIPAQGVCVFVGRTNTGKTLLMRDIMAYKCRNFKKCVVMTGSSTSASDFAQHVPACFVYDGFREDVLEKIVDKQDRDQKLGRCKHIAIILDDLAYLATHIKSCEVIKRIMFNGRQYKILLFLSMQYCKLFPPDFRSNINFVFCTFEKNPLNRRHVFEAFNNVFRDYDAFDRAMCALTKDYRAIVLDNCSSKSMAIADNVFWYKAHYPALEWRMNDGGSMWRFHNRMYDDRYFLRRKPDDDDYADKFGSNGGCGARKKKKPATTYKPTNRKKRT